MTSRLLGQLSQLNIYNKINWRTIYTSNTLSAFHEYDKKSSYPRISDFVEEQLSILQRIKIGYSQLKEEMSIMKEELIDKFYMDPITSFRQGEVDVKWKFNGDPELLKKWVVTCDSDYNEGFSKATLEYTPQGTALFSGILDTRIPKNGKVKDTGYCNFRSVLPRKAFRRAEPMDWGMYTHLILRIRGDGRNYMLNITLNNYFDITWNDMYGFVLYTRGGPYWQYVKIPFSKFYLSHKGRIQDSQAPIRLNIVNHLGITCGDGISGPFNLEIDYIGLERDDRFVENFAYEMYRPPNPYYI